MSTVVAIDGGSQFHIPVEINAVIGNSHVTAVAKQHDAVSNKKWNKKGNKSTKILCGKTTKTLLLLRKQIAVVLSNGLAFLTWE